MSFDTVFDVMIGGFQYEIAYKCKGLRFTESGVILTDCLDEFGNKLDIESVEVRNAPIVIEKKLFNTNRRKIMEMENLKFKDKEQAEAFIDKMETVIQRAVPFTSRPKGSAQGETFHITDAHCFWDAERKIVIIVIIVVYLKEKKVLK